MSSHSTKHTAEINGTQYEWYGGFGAVFQSRERGVKPGTMRVIGGIVFYAYMVRRESRLKAPVVSWTLPGRFEDDRIREIKAELFS